MKRMFVLLSCICALAVVIDRVNAQEAPEAEKPIEIDFVRKDIHVVMHYIGLKSGLNITVEGDITAEITWMPLRMTLDELWKALREVYDLDVRVNGTFVYITKSTSRQDDPWYRRQRAAFEASPLLPVMPRRSEPPEAY